jgi:two-component system, OmpR family, sensor histidine kinase SenX3
MAVSGRQKSVASFLALGAGLIAVTLLLYVGWVVLNWRTGLLVFFGVVLLTLIVSGVVLNTIFLVREIRRNEQHDAFINAVTHELKTPVASIRLYLETLQKHPVDEPKRSEFYRVMLEDCDRLFTTIEQILLTGRVGVSSRRLNLTTVDLAEVVQACMDRARILHPLPAESLEYIPGPPITILGDPDEVRTAVSNLIENAVKYSGDDARVRVRTAAVDQFSAAVRVTDNGAGIPRAELKQIFRRFHRVTGPAAVRVKGMGLGLYIVRSVAKRHGGRVWAESEGPGKGSTFVLEFPIAR